MKAVSVRIALGEGQGNGSTIVHATYGRSWSAIYMKNSKHEELPSLQKAMSKNVFYMMFWIDTPLFYRRTPLPPPAPVLYHAYLEANKTITMLETQGRTVSQLKVTQVGSTIDPPLAYITPQRG
jgi:hypothetical protein